MTGIIIPLLIHLWNVRKGKTLKVGNIAFFSETPVSRARSFRLTDLLQLLIRCLIFIMLAMFIAKPILSSAFSPNQEGWLLMEKSTIAAAYREYGKEIDSMLDRGAELHELGGQFAEMKLSDSTNDKPGEISYWELLRQLENRISNGLPVTLYTENRLARFGGERPMLSLNLDWKQVNMDREATWIENAYASYDDSIMVVMGKTNGERTVFNKIVLPKSDPMIKPDPLHVQLENDTMRVDTNALSILIYADAGTKDGSYLASAIEAAREYTKRKIQVSIVKDTGRIEGADWLFWLSASKLPGNAKAKNIFMYSGGKSHPVYSNFSLQDENALIPAYKIFSDSVIHAGTAVWLTGSGQPMLTRHPARQIYIFYSRLDPKWNGLVWNDQFPQFVTDLLYPVQQVRGSDHRLIDGQQILPVEKKGKKFSTPVISRPIDHWFWLIAFVLFIAERMIAYRKQKPANG